MKTFRVIYLPYGREDKEWIDVTANTEQEAINNFNYGVLLSIREDVEEDGD
jgi:hypothetical protein